MTDETKKPVPPKMTAKQTVKYHSYKKINELNKDRSIRKKMAESRKNVPADHPRNLFKQSQTAKIKEFMASGLGRGEAINKLDEYNFTHPHRKVTAHNNAVVAANNSKRRTSILTRSLREATTHSYPSDEIKEIKEKLAAAKAAPANEVAAKKALEDANAALKTHNKAMNPQWEGAAARAKDLNKKLNVPGVTFNRGEGIPGSKPITKWEVQHVRHTRDATRTRGLTRGRGGAVKGGVVPEVAAHVGGMSTKVKVGLGVLGLGAAAGAYYLHGKNKQK